MATKTLANFNEPTINGLTSGMVFASTAMENIYQAEIEKGGRGVTQKYSNDTTGAQIRVVRPLPLPIDARELGSSINGGNFSAFAYQPESNEYGLNIITVIDDQVDIPDVRMEMIPVDIAKMYIQNISDKVVLNMNAIKIASRTFTCFSADAVDHNKAYIVKFGANDKILDKVIETNAKLNKGDKDNGVSVFPTKDRIGLVTNDYYSALLTSSGIFSLGGANYAYDIARKGSLDPNSNAPELLDDGYLGTIANVPYHFVSDLVMEVACKYLGFPTNTYDDVLCHIASAHGNLFGLATGNSINTIPSPLGQGVRLQPKYRLGSACIMPKSVAWLVKDTWANPYGVKALFSNEVTYSYKAPGSRQILTATLTSGDTATSFTPSCTKLVKGADGSSVEASVTTGLEGKWVVGDCDSIGAFLTAYNSNNAVKGSVTAFGQANTFTGVTANKVVTLLLTDKDGTMALAKATAHA